MSHDPPPPHDEPAAVQARYARRASAEWRYNLLNPAALLAAQERQRAIARLFVARGWTDLAPLRLAEVGCGTGGNLLELLRLGFAPEHLFGIELLPERARAARHVLPPAVAVHCADVAQAPELLPQASQDVVYQATVFSSLLDDAFQQRLADVMWHWVRPGGGVLWYDFTMDNPRNPDVRGVPLSRVRALFPAAQVQAERLTLAPPIARAVVRAHPALYGLFNRWPLRTHLLAWIEKPR